MRNTTIILMAVGLLSLCSTTYATTPLDSAKTDPARKKRKLIEFYLLPKETVYLDIRQPGSIHIFQRTFVPGEIKYEDNGFRFIPFVTAPDGYPQEVFDKAYWYNAHFKDFFFAYDDVKSFNSYRGMLKTKDGKKYRIASREKRELRENIRVHLE
jgi:hypothetical protein